MKRYMIMPEMYERFKAAFQALYKVAVSQVKTNYLFSNLGEFISVRGYRVFHNELSIGYFTMITFPVEKSRNCPLFER